MRVTILGTLSLKELKYSASCSWMMLERKGKEPFLNNFSNMTTSNNALGINSLPSTPSVFPVHLINQSYCFLFPTAHVPLLDTSTLNKTGILSSKSELRYHP